MRVRDAAVTVTRAPLTPSLTLIQAGKFQNNIGKASKYDSTKFTVQEKLKCKTSKTLKWPHK